MLLQLLRIHGHSMQPKIVDNQRVVVSGIPYFFISPKVNDVVAFKFEHKIFVKRIRSVDKDKFFLEGDNKKDSLDSRNFGFIKIEDILGKVIWY